MIPEQPRSFYKKAVVQRCSVKKAFLEISQNSQENTCARVSFLIKMQAYNFIKKETLAQAFSCESSKFKKHLFLYNTPRDCFCLYNRFMLTVVGISLVLITLQDSLFN